MSGAVPAADCTTGDPAVAGTRRARAVARQLDLAAEALGRGDRPSEDDALDLATRHLRLVEALLEDMAGSPRLATGLSRHLLAVRDDLRVHAFAASALRAVDLAPNAGEVLRRAVESGRAAMGAIASHR